MNIPTHLKYTRDHTWIKQEADETLSVGITDYAQESLGDIVFIALPESGLQVLADQPICVIESVKSASDIHAPVSGEIVACHTSLTEAPEKMNADAYAAWLFRIRPANAGVWDTLLDAAAYRQEVEG